MAWHHINTENSVVRVFNEITISFEKECYKLQADLKVATTCRSSHFSINHHNRIYCSVHEHSNYNVY